MDEGAAKAESSTPPRWPPIGAAAIIVAIIVSGVATAASWLLPDVIVATAVGGVFLAATWFLVLRRRDVDARSWGLALGGVLEVPPAPWTRTLRESLRAIAFALLVAAIVFPPFVYAFVRWWHVAHLAWRAPTKPLDAILGQLVVVALPEEAFFRGYLQTALDRAWPRARVRLFGADVGAGLLLSSAIFALGHLTTIPNPARLAVFFPSLLFGWMRARSGGVGAGVVFHASCNVLSEGLARAAGMG